MANSKGLKVTAEAIEVLKRQLDTLKAEFEKFAQAAERTIGETICSFRRSATGTLLVELDRGSGAEGIAIAATDFAQICNWFKKHYGETTESMAAPGELADKIATSKAKG